MRLVSAIILAALVLVSASPVGAQSGSPDPAAQATTKRPILHEPLLLPKGRKPILASDRAPDATVSRRGVRLDLWVPKKAIRTGRWVPATMRVTNLSGRPINHYGQVGCDTGNDQLSFDFGGLFDAGTAWDGKAARFKKLLLRQWVSSGMTTVQPVRTDCLGSVGIDETLESGRAFTVSKVAFARYPWASQPLPSGKAKVTACYRFEFGRASDDAPAPDRHYDECVSAPVRIKGPRVEYPSPQALTDAMLSDPTFRTWVEDRYPNAQFHTSIDGPWRKRGYTGWAKDGYVGGPAPEEPVHIRSQAGGKNGDWVRDLVIDAWTGEVLETTIVGGIAGAPEGDYPTHSPSAAPPASASPATTFDVFAESPTTTVSLGLYSGRPDPSWELSEEESAALTALLESLPRVDGSAPSGGLGYHGFTIERLTPEGMPRLLLAFEGTVSDPASSYLSYLDDPDRSVERLLLESGREQLSAVEIDGAGNRVRADAVSGFVGGDDRVAGRVRRRLTRERHRSPQTTACRRRPSREKPQPAQTRPGGAGRRGWCSSHQARGRPGPGIGGSATPHRWQ